MRLIEALLLLLSIIGLGIKSQAWHLDECFSYVGVSNIAAAERDSWFLQHEILFLRKRGLPASMKITMGDSLRSQEIQLIPTGRVGPFTTHQMKLQFCVYR